MVNLTYNYPKKSTKVQVQITGYNHAQNLRSNVKKSSKIGQDEKTLISVSAQFVTTSTKFLFMERRLETRLCLLPFL